MQKHTEDLLKEVELITAETEKYRFGRLHHATYGPMTPVSSLLDSNFDDYSKLFIEIPLLTYQKDLHISPGGKYRELSTKVTWTKCQSVTKKSSHLQKNTS